MVTSMLVSLVYQLHSFSYPPSPKHFVLWSCFYHILSSFFVDLCRSMSSMLHIHLHFLENHKTCSVHRSLVIRADWNLRGYMAAMPGYAANLFAFVVNWQSWLNLVVDRCNFWMVKRLNSHVCCSNPYCCWVNFNVFKVFRISTKPPKRK